MALTVLASFAGSPGVTTATLAAGVHWPRPVVVIEADTSNVGQVMTGFFRAALDATAGMHQVVLAITRGVLTAQTVLDPDGGIAIPVHLLPPIPRTPLPALPAGHRMWVIPGWRDLSSLGGAQTVWGRLAVLAEQLDEYGIDVLIDLGRLAIDDPRQPLLDAADQVVVVATATLTDLNRLHRRLRLTDLIDRTGSGQDRYRLLLIDAPTSPVSPADFTRATLPVAATIGFNPTGAAVFCHGNEDPRPARNRYRSDLRRAVTTLARPAAHLTGTR
jgi:hypothetical protein